MTCGALSESTSPKPLTADDRQGDSSKIGNPWLGVLKIVTNQSLIVKRLSIFRIDAACADAVMSEALRDTVREGWIVFRLPN
jgi:hypothetical protein